MFYISKKYKTFGLCLYDWVCLGNFELMFKICRVLCINMYVNCKYLWNTKYAFIYHLHHCWKARRHIHPCRQTDTAHIISHFCQCVSSGGGPPTASSAQPRARRSTTAYTARSQRRNAATGFTTLLRIHPIKLSTKFRGSFPNIHHWWAVWFRYIKDPLSLPSFQWRERPCLKVCIH